MENFQVSGIAAVGVEKSETDAMPLTYTALQFSRGLGKSRQAMQRLLSSVAPSVEVMVNGNLARTWSVCALPIKLQEQLLAESERRGFRNPEHLLAEPLANRFLIRQRTISKPRGQPKFDTLVSYLEMCGKEPTEIERHGTWTVAFEEYSRLVTNGDSPKRAARRVREFLFLKAPFLAPTREALHKSFGRKLTAWIESGRDAKALRDRRENNGAGFQLPEEERDLLIHRAVFYYRGNTTSAWRDLLHKGFFESVRNRYAEKAYSKSHVPTSIRDSVSAEVLTVMHQGPRAFDSIKGFVDRNYDGIASRKCYMSDDFTMPIYFLIPDGKGWFSLTRGQTLIFIDFRSLKILGWSLQPERNYSSLTIRSLCTHVFGDPDNGVPNILYFERGIWQSSKLITGDKKKLLPYEFSEVTQGLREFGIRFIHATKARSKPVERVGGLLQDRMGAEPGYCGRDERRDAPESLRKQMAAVEARKAGCLDLFYTYEGWNKRLGQIILDYNATVQQGRILKNISPDEPFVKLADPNDPPTICAKSFVTREGGERGWK